MKYYFVYICFLSNISYSKISYQNNLIKTFIEATLNINITPNDKCFSVTYNKLIKDSLRQFENGNYVESFYLMKNLINDINNNCNYNELYEIYKRILKYIVSNTNNHLSNFDKLYSKLSSIIAIIENNEDVGVMLGKCIQILFDIEHNDDFTIKYEIMNEFNINEFINGTIIGLEKSNKESKHLCLNEIENHKTLLYNVSRILWNDFLNRQEILAINLRLLFNIAYHTYIPKYCRLIEFIEILCNDILNKYKNLSNLFLQFSSIIKEHQMITTKAFQILLHSLSNSHSLNLGISLGTLIKILLGFYIN